MNELKLEDAWNEISSHLDAKTKAKLEVFMGHPEREGYTPTAVLYMRMLGLSIKGKRGDSTWNTSLLIFASALNYLLEPEIGAGPIFSVFARPFFVPLAAQADKPERTVLVWHLASFWTRAQLNEALEEQCLAAHFVKMGKQPRTWTEYLEEANKTKENA